MNLYRTRNQMMPYGDMVKILLDVLNGLGYAHAQGMIHRDIKPANILITRQGQAVLADFGIVQIVGSTRHTVSGALLGTLNYMAPEQGLRGQSDTRSDLYSLGVVFYELLTGRPPFDADTPLAILMKHVNDPLPRPGLINPHVPPAFEKMVLKVLSKEPDDRYQSANEMAQALSQAAVQVGVNLPDQISAPFSFSTAEAPGEPVAVYSGENRPAQNEAGFAKEDTANMSFAATIPPASVPLTANSPDSANPFAGITDRRALKRAYKQAYKEAYKHTDKDYANTSGKPDLASVPHNVNRILTGVFSIPVWNLCMLIVCAVTTNWDAFGRAWPAELLLVAFMLSVIMEVVGALGMVVPIYILTGVGGLLAYYTLLNSWDQWYLWLLIPLIIFGVIRYLVTKSAELDHEEAFNHSVNLGKDLTQINLGLIAIVTGVAFFYPLIK